MGGSDTLDVLMRWFPGVIGILAILLGCITAYARSRAVAAAGPLKLRATRPIARAWWRRADIALLCVLPVLPVLLLVRDSGLWEDLPFYLLVLGLLVATVLQRLAGDRPRELELREKGLLTNGALFRPWDRLQSYRWEDSTRPILVIRFSGPDDAVRCPVQAEQKDEVESMLRQHLASLGEGEAEEPSDGLCEADRGE